MTAYGTARPVVADTVRRAAADVAIAVRALERELAETHPAKLAGPALDDVADAMGRLTVVLDNHTPAGAP